MVETLQNVQERADEDYRARIEGREPDYSEENLALYRVPQHVNDPNQRDEDRSEPQAVTSDPDSDAITQGFYPEPPHVPVNENMAEPMGTTVEPEPEVTPEPEPEVEPEVEPVVEPEPEVEPETEPKTTAAKTTTAKTK